MIGEKQLAQSEHIGAKMKCKSWEFFISVLIFVERLAELLIELHPVKVEITMGYWTVKKLSARCKRTSAYV